MHPPTLNSPPRKVLGTLPLSQSSFSPYGAAITTPIPATLNTPPADISSLVAPHQHLTGPVLANQGTAVKHSPISPMQNVYGLGQSKLPGSPRMSLFSCFPRRLRTRSAGKKDDGSASGLFDVRILERHPFTSQTFIPLSYGLDNEHTSGERTPGPSAGDDGIRYLVIVAPSLVGQTAVASVESSDGGKSKTVLVYDPPDLENMRAFLARPGQAVTYAAGTWHAPMVVLGERRVDFVVVQFVNGIDGEDCQEVGFGEGVVVDVGSDLDQENGVRAKL